MKRIVQLLLTTAPYVVIVLSVIELIVSNQFVGSGKLIRSVDISIDAIRSENEQLQQQVASASSLLTIHSRAMEIGFIDPKPSQYLTIAPSNDTVAYNVK